MNMHAKPEMDKIILKVLRKLYKKIFPSPARNRFALSKREAEEANTLISDLLTSDDSVMIARFGGFELATLYNYMGTQRQSKEVMKYIKGNEPAWWWTRSLISSLNTNAGFFPVDLQKIEKFCELMLADMKEVDILGSWLKEEEYFKNQMHAHRVSLFFLEPFWTDRPWTKILEGKRVLVVHPFVQTIMRQYEKRELLFANKDVLPTFESLNIVKAVQSIGEGDPRFADWFQALEYMKREIDNHEYDFCLIGAGAYGFPLAAHVKRQGKKAIHLGGALQLLFGIRGKRWENPEYGVNIGIPRGFYSRMMNEHWVRPNENETPRKANQVEGACYW